MAGSRRRAGRAGGIAALYRLLEVYGEAIEADLLRVYRVDLRTVGRGLSWRRLRVLIAGLPRGAAFHEAWLADNPPDADADPPPWDIQTHLLAGIFDALTAANWQRSGGQGKRPDPLPRPGEKTATRLRFGQRPGADGARVGGTSKLTQEQKLALLRAQRGPV